MEIQLIAVIQRACDVIAFSRLTCRVFAFLAFIATAAAHDEQHSQYSPETLQWFKTLTNQAGQLCCNGLDSVTPHGWRLGGQGYEVQLHPGAPWLAVPAQAMVRQPNLLNEVHVWPVFDAMGNVWFRCFMPGAGG